MAGVYARGEFTDNFGTDWKIDIYDTTYGGLTYPFTPAGNGFDRQYDGIDNKLMFTPSYCSNVTVKMLLNGKSEDSPILALIADLPQGKEDQYYCLIYRETDLWFAGMILTDTSQYDDNVSFVFEMNARDGLNRLENFDYPIEDIEDEWISELDAIILGLQICGIERFYTDEDKYIGIAVNWHEESQAKIKTSLAETRVRKDSFIEDEKTGRPKRALKAIEDILQTYGATIRYEAGCWRIVQMDALMLTDGTIDYEYYSKLGANVGATIITNEPNSQEIYVDENNTNNVIVNMALPSLYGVTETVKIESKIRWGINENIVGTPWTLSQSVDTLGNATYAIKCKVGFTPLLAGSGALTRVYFEIERDGYRYVLNIKSSSWTYGSRAWISLATIAASPADWSNIWCDFRPADLVYIEQEIYLPIPPNPIHDPSGQPFIITTAVSDLILSTGVDWTSIYHELSEVWADSTTEDLGFVATNTIYNAASMFYDEQLKYADSPRDFIVGKKQIYNGSDWKHSVGWGEDELAAEWIPFAQLLCQTAVFFQRFPRLIIQGSFILPNYQSVNIIIWRSRKFMMMNGSFDANRGIWTGSWVELIRQSDDVVSAPVNPYRNILIRIEDGLEQLKIITKKTATDLAGLNTDVFQLKRLAVIQKLTDYTLLQTDSGFAFNNSGESDDETIYTLPEIVLGLKYTIGNVYNTKEVKISTEDQILFDGTTGSLLTLQKIASLTIAAVSETQWQVISCDGFNHISLT